MIEDQGAEAKKVKVKKNKNAFEVVKGEKVKKSKVNYESEGELKNKKIKVPRSSKSNRMQPSINLIVGENVQTNKRARPSSARANSF